MKVIAVMSPKGGIGKTTTADSITHLLGTEQGKKVLILEADPQGDTSKTFAKYEPEGKGMSELLERHKKWGGIYDTIDLIEETEYENIDIIQGNGYLMKTDMELMMKTQEANQVERIKEALKEVEDEYDYCICDCGRLLDMVVINVMMAADLVIAPVKMGGYEIEAIYNLDEQIQELREMNPKLRMKLLMTMKQKNKATEEFEEWLKTKSGMEMFETVIRRSVVAEKATIALKPLPEFAKSCIATKDYRELVKEIMEE